MNNEKEILDSLSILLDKAHDNINDNTYLIKTVLNQLESIVDKKLELEKLIKSDKKLVVPANRINYFQYCQNHGSLMHEPQPSPIYEFICVKCNRQLRLYCFTKIICECGAKWKLEVNAVGEE
jgi:hypothetical protein